MKSPFPGMDPHIEACGLCRRSVGRNVRYVVTHRAPAVGFRNRLKAHDPQTSNLTGKLP
jgi:hypothetical protein